MLAGIIYLFSTVIVITKLPPQQSSGFVRLSWTTEDCCCQETCVSWCPLESQCDTLQIVNLHLHHNHYSHYFVIKILWMLIIMCRHQHHPQINIITSGFGTAGDSLHSDINTIFKLFSIDPVVHSFIIYFCLPVSRFLFENLDIVLISVDLSIIFSTALPKKIGQPEIMKFIEVV